MEHRERFSCHAQAYSAFRPGYPRELIDALLNGLPKPALCADIGAGTGISSRALADAGAHVIAIEPNARMREEASVDERIVWRGGSGEETGLGDACVDLAVAFQAFHWFATQAAIDEFRRIARKRIAIVQYERDESDAFTQAYGDIVRRYATDDTETLRLRAVRFFLEQTGARSSTWSSDQVLDETALLGRAASTSYLPHDGPQASALRDELRQVFEKYARDGQVAMAMTTTLCAGDVG